MAREAVLYDGGARECLVDLHGRATRVSEYVGDSLALQSFDEDIGAFSGLVRGKSGNDCLRFRNNGGCGGGGGGGDIGRRGSWVGLRYRTGNAKAGGGGAEGKRGEGKGKTGNGFLRFGGRRARRGLREGGVGVWSSGRHF